MIIPCFLCEKDLKVSETQGKFFIAEYKQGYPLICDNCADKVEWENEIT